MEELDRSIERIAALADLPREQRIRREIAMGLDPNRPEESLEELHAKVMAMREQNDSALAEIWRKSLRVVVECSYAGRRA